MDIIFISKNFNYLKLKFNFTVKNGFLHLQLIDVQYFLSAQHTALFFS